MFNPVFCMPLRTGMLILVVLDIILNFGIIAAGGVPMYQVFKLLQTIASSNGQQGLDGVPKNLTPENAQSLVISFGVIMGSYVLGGFFAIMITLYLLCGTIARGGCCCLVCLVFNVLILLFLISLLGADISYGYRQFAIVGRYGLFLTFMIITLIIKAYTLVVIYFFAQESQQSSVAQPQPMLEGEQPQPMNQGTASQVSVTPTDIIEERK